MTQVTESLSGSSRTKKARLSVKFFLKWEWLLVLIFLAINIINIQLYPKYLNARLLLDATQMFMDKALIVLPMTMILVMGEIDISVGSIVALSSVLMGISHQAGLPMPLAMGVCLLTGALCGFINGFLLIKIKNISSMIVTLIGMITYRGIAEVILKDQAVGGFPSWYNELGWGYVGKYVPIVLVVFVIMAVILSIVLNHSVLGRRIYAIGANSTASQFSGIHVERIKLLIFTICGFVSGITGLFLSSRMGSVRSNIASGYELDVIAMVVLGGIGAYGGKGRIVGPIIAVFIIGFLRYGLGLINIESKVLLVIIGLLLILSIAIPNTSQILSERSRTKNKSAAK